MSNFEELTKTLIQTQILQALKEAPEYIDALVQSVMEQEVNENGNKPDYYNKTKMPWLEWCVRNAIRKAAQDAVLESLREIEPDIKKSVKNSLNSDEIINVFAKRIINTMEDYKINVEVILDKGDN